MAGISLGRDVIADDWKLLGHTQVQTTHRYAHLFDDPLRVGLQQVDQMLRPKLKLVEAVPVEQN